MKGDQPPAFNQLSFFANGEPTTRSLGPRIEVEWVDILSLNASVCERFESFLSLGCLAVVFEYLHLSLESHHVFVLPLKLIGLPFLLLPVGIKIYLPK